MSRLYQIVRSRIEYLVIIVLTTMLVAVVITLASPSEYAASARILVVQKQQTIDAYTASKSADYIASLLNEALYSNSFLDALVKSDNSLSSHLSSDTTTRSKEWAKKVDSSVLSNKGILSLKVYDEDSKLALHYASVIVATLTSQGASYYGGNETIELRVIDAPSVTKKPARPSLPLNVAASVLVGLALDVVYIFILDVRLARRLEEREAFGHVHPEAENGQDLEFLRDGHTAHVPTQHIVGENFGQTNPSNTPKNIPLVEDSGQNIADWMKNR